MCPVIPRRALEDHERHCGVGAEECQRANQVEVCEDVHAEDLDRLVRLLQELAARRIQLLDLSLKRLVLLHFLEACARARQPCDRVTGASAFTCSTSGGGLLGLGAYDSSGSGSGNEAEE